MRAMPMTLDRVQRAVQHGSSADIERTLRAATLQMRRQRIGLRTVRPEPPGGSRQFPAIQVSYEQP